MITGLGKRKDVALTHAENAKIAGVEIQDQLDQPEAQGEPELRDRQDLQVPQEAQVAQGAQAPQEQQVAQVRQERQERQEPPANPLLLFMAM